MEEYSNTTVDYAMIFGTSKLDRILIGDGICEQIDVYHPKYLMPHGQTVIFNTDVWFDISVDAYSFWNHMKFKKRILHAIQEHYPDVSDIPGKNFHNEYDISVYFLTPMSSHFNEYKPNDAIDCNQEKLDVLKEKFPEYDYVFDVPLIEIDIKTQCLNNKNYRNNKITGKKCEKYF